MFSGMIGGNNVRPNRPGQPGQPMNMQQPRISYFK